MPRKRRSRRSTLESASGFVEAALSKLGVKPAWRAVAAWPEVCGPTIAARTAAIELRNAILYVQVTSPGWAQDLTFVKRELLERLCTGTRLRIDDIRFSVGPLPPPVTSRKSEPPPPPPKRPPGPDVIERVGAATGAISDPELRDALRELGFAMLR